MIESKVEPASNGFAPGRYARALIYALLPASALLAGLGSAPARAQGAAPSVQSSTPARTTEIEEVTVTARRTVENLQQVPISITALSQRDLERQAIVAPDDLNMKIPSLGVTTQGNQRDGIVYQVRGQGQAAFGAEPAVVTYFAEVPTISAGPGLLFDLQNIQVLKGPQGTLFGRNTTGGAILLEPHRPDGTFGGYGAFSYGNYNLTRFEGALNVPVVDDKFLMRAAIDVNRRDGFTKDLTTGRDLDNRSYEAYRLGATFRPTETIENYLLVNYMHSRTNGAATILDAVNPNGLVAAVFGNAALQAFANQQKLGFRETVTPGIDAFEVTRAFGMTNATTVELSDNLTVKNIIGYRLYQHKTAGEITGYPFPVIQTIATGEWDSGSSGPNSAKTWSEELQFQGSSLGGNLTWIAGGYLQSTRPNSARDATISGQFGTPITIQALKYDKSYAVFAHAVYAITDELKLSVGGRYTWDERRQVSSQYIGTPAVCVLGPLPNCQADLRAKFSAPTGDIDLTYQVTPDVMLYGSIRRGYKSGGFSISAPTPAGQIFQPEYVTDFEVGAKTDFVVGSMPSRLNLSVYRSNFKDLQISGIALIGGNLLAFTSNAGRGYVQGVELEGLIKPTDHITLSAHYAYTDPVYTRNDFGGQDVKNAPFNNVAKNKFGVNAIVDFTVGGENLSVSANFNYQSKVYFNVPLVPVNFNPNLGQKGYGLLGFQAEWRHMFGSNVTTSVFATNVTNKIYKLFQGDLYNSLGTSSSLIGEPRMFGVTGRYEF